MAGQFAEWVAGSGPGIANHLWQSTAVVAGAWLVTLTLRQNQARVRYAVWLAASVKFLIPFSLLIAAGNLLPHPRQAVAPVVYSAMDVVEEPFADVVPVVAPTVHVATMRERVAAAAPAGLFGVWLLGAAIVLVRWGRGWSVARRTLRSAEVVSEGREWEILRRVEGQEIPGAQKRGTWGTRRSGMPIELRLSAERMEPGIFGVGRPVLVWPRELSARLEDEHIEAIVAHELAHVRRRDNLTGALHMVVETVFWFHPAVWWMERQMVKEREQACDEAVVSVARFPGAQVRGTWGTQLGSSSLPLIPPSGMNGAPGDLLDVHAAYAEIYAEALLKTCRFCIESPLVCVAGVTGADLKQRVVEIVTGRALLRMSWAKTMLLAVAAVCVIAAPVVLGQAKAARLMRAAMEAAPKPVQAMAKAMMAEAGEAQASAPADNAAPADADMALGPEFEVATIRPGNTNDGRHWFGFMTDVSGRFTGSDVRLDFLVSFAYSDMPSQVHVSGGPAWVKSDVFDINAKIDDAYMPGWDKLSYQERNARVKPMIRTLLAQRFKLKLHVEMKPTPVYVLVQTKGGAKVKEVPAPVEVDNGPDSLKNWNAEHPGEPKPGSVSCSGGFCAGTAMQMKNAIGQIGGNAHADRMVIDGTNLKGFYDFKIPILKDNDPDAMPEVEDALGMKFESRTVPVKTFVIDSVEKPSVDGAEVGSSGEGQLSGEYRKWLDEDAHWLITQQERADFLKLTTDKDRDAFIESFWEKRNAPGAAKGAYKQEIYARIADANDNFAVAGRPGWATDRGRAYIVYGKPDMIVVHPAGEDEVYEAWNYNHFGGMGGSANLKFVRKDGDYQLEGAWPQVAAAIPAMRLRFDVVSIRRNLSASHEMMRQSAANTDEIAMTNVPLALVVLYANWINDPNLVTAMPQWAWTERYDITAKVAPENLAQYHALTNRQCAAMLEVVLADRFKLQAHHETKDRPVYALVVAKGGPKLREAQPGETHPNADKANPNAFQHGATIFATGAGQLTGEAASMSDLAVSLSTRGFEALGLGRPVIDKTSLNGKYDFTLQSEPAAADGDGAPEAAVSSLSSALDNQVGLKLQPATAPIDLLVIDHIERPTEN